MESMADIDMSASWDAFLDAYVELQNSVTIMDDLRKAAVEDLPKTKQKKHIQQYEDLVEKVIKEREK